MVVKIRPYLESDEAAVVALWREIFPDAPAWNPPAGDIRRKLKVQRELFLVAAVGENVVGTVMGGYDGHRGWVYYLAVRPECRRKGIGTTLMKEIEVQLAQIGCPKINLQIRASNKDVVDFYKSLGYEVEDRVSMGKPMHTAKIPT